MLGRKTTILNSYRVLFLRILCGLVLCGMGLCFCGCENPVQPQPESPWAKYWSVYYTSPNPLRQVVFVSEDEAWLVNYKQMVHWKDGVFTEVPIPQSQYIQEDYELQNCAFSDPNHGLLLVWNGTIFKYEYGVWSELPPIDPVYGLNVHYIDLAMIAPDDAWVSGYSSLQPDFALWHYDGSTWTRYDVEYPVDRFRFKSSNDGYVTYDGAYNRGGALRWDGTLWTQVHVGNYSSGFGFDKQNNMFIASWYSDYNRYGLVKITDQVEGDPVESSYFLCFQAIHNNSSGDIWALGKTVANPESDVIAHWVNQEWHYTTICPRGLYFESVFVTEGGEVWATFCADKYNEQYLAKLRITIP